MSLVQSRGLRSRRAVHGSEGKGVGLPEALAASREVDAMDGPVLRRIPGCVCEHSQTLQARLRPKVYWLRPDVECRERSVTLVDFAVRARCQPGTIAGASKAKVPQWRERATVGPLSQSDNAGEFASKASDSGPWLTSPSRSLDGDRGRAFRGRRVRRDVGRGGGAATLSSICLTSASSFFCVCANSISSCVTSTRSAFATKIRRRRRSSCSLSCS
jgi:hypothetical protein